MRDIPKTKEIYQHFKGNKYQIVAIAKHSETRELMVVYKPMYGDEEVYCRPLDMFMELLDVNQYPDAKQKYRFEKETDIEETALDPLLEEFLDTDSYEEKLNILVALKHRITEEMLNTMSISADIELNEGTLEEKYAALKNGILMREKFEGNRMR